MNNNLRLRVRGSQAPKTPPLGEEFLETGRYFLKKLRWARDHGQHSVELSLRTCEALRPAITMGLDELEPQERTA